MQAKSNLIKPDLLQTMNEPVLVGERRYSDHFATVQTSRSENSIQILTSFFGHGSGLGHVNSLD